MKAWELLSSPEKWTQGTYARDKKAQPVNINSTEAESFCVTGAITRCYPNVYEQDQKIFNLGAKVGGIVIWNDHSTYEQVHSVLKELDI